MDLLLTVSDVSDVDWVMLVHVQAEYCYRDLRKTKPFHQRMGMLMTPQYTLSWLQLSIPVISITFKIIVPACK